MSESVQDLLARGVAVTDEALEHLLPGAEVLPHSIHRAMRHSTFAGGKRLRPLLAMESARMVAGGALPAGAAELGSAIEMIHTYSLIHDDLPALDNDDLRRGKPTAHVVYGEAIAILAGDALQTLAFQTLAKLPCAAETTVQIVREMAMAIGTGVGGALPSGMIGGQVMDIEGEGQKPTAELVEAIHRAKTGALITVSIVAGGLLGGASSEQVALLRGFGERAGLAFQIVDDVLDVTQSSEALGKTAGKDTASDKATWPAVFGLNESRSQAHALIQDAFVELQTFGSSAQPLKALAQYLVDRTH